MKWGVAMHNYKHAEERYRSIRNMANQDAERRLSQLMGISIHLCEISEAALAVADDWPNWSWRKEVKRFRRRPRRIECAVWLDMENEKQLAALILGRISDRKIVATIHFLERNPVATTLEGLVGPLATRYLEIQAAAFGCKFISINDPLSELIEFYKALGFTQVIEKNKKVVRLLQRLS